MKVPFRYLVVGTEKTTKRPSQDTGYPADIRAQHLTQVLSLMLDYPDRFQFIGERIPIKNYVFFAIKFPTFERW